MISPPTRPVRFIALFFLADVLLSIVAPTVSYALTTGPNQTEFTSYEPIGTTDMVNLSTGDFTYNAPLIDVPSPEGGFSLPLSYHSGIGLEDEASWAGLGWNINPGSISRNKVSSADDDFDNFTSINVQDPGGSGYVKNYVLYQRSWDSEKGYGGAINLLDVAGFSWNDHTGMQDGTVMGLTFNKDKATFSVEKFFNGLTTVASIGAAAAAKAAIKAGAQAAASGATGAAATKAIALGKAEAAGLAASTGMDWAMTGLNLYNGYKSQGSQGSIVGGWSVDKTSSNWGFRQDYKYWLDNTREEHSYGALYLGQMKNNTSVNPSTSVDDIIVPRVGNAQNYVRATRFPQSIYHDTGTPAITSDMYSYVEPGVNYAWSFNPTHVAYDAYSVMGPGIGGSMAPYRPEVGSLVFPKKLNNGSNKINLVPFLEEGVDIDKVQFKYNGDLSNSYTYHNSGGPGMSISHSGNNYSTNRVYYNIPDPKLAAAAARTEADRDGLYNKRLAQGKHVQWFSNQEMASDLPSTSGKVMEYQPLNDATRRIERGSIWPVKGIGAYAITNADGTTYHYALPVYNKMQEDFTGVSSDVSRKFARSKSGDFYSRGSNGEWYATTWLLTGITGPDFVDRGEIGSIDAEDQGYWVKFDYGRFAHFYQWRFPYTGYTPDGDRLTYSKGIRETYYLNTIQTRTHTALFLKDIRKDGRGAYRLTASGSIPQWATPEDNMYPASSLALSEIVLLNNADYQQLQNNGFTKNSATGATIDRTQLQAPASAQQATTCTLSNVYDVYDVQDNAAFRSFIDQKAQRKIVLNTSYTLCPGTTNSFASATNAPPVDGSATANRLGKLTLNSLSYYGPNNVKLFPDFKFQYNSPNPAYNSSSWDGWGSYNANGATSHYSNASDPTVWHLTDIISPLGGRVSIEYESDDYSSVSGEPIRQRLPISGFQPTDNTHGMLYFDLKNIAPLTLPQLLSNGVTTTLQDFQAKQKRRCWGFTGYGDWEYNDYNIPATQQVQNLQTAGFLIQRPNTDGGSGNSISGCPNSTWDSATGYLEVTLPSKRGGGVRVASLTVRDEANNAYRTGYLYTQSGQRGGVTSGVVSQEPALVKTVDYPFYNLYDFPNTPVLYGKVTVVEGMKSDTDYTHKAEYTFNTPTSSCVSVSASSVLDNLNWGGYYGNTIQDSKLFTFDVQNHSSRVGRVERIKTIDNTAVATGQIDFGYTEELPNNQGKFTGGSMMCEVAQGPNRTDTYHFKLSRTTKTAYPNVLTSVRTTSNGVTSTKNNTAWDFLTGVVTEEDETRSDGQTYQTRTVPAYQKYPELGPKAASGTNKNMLTQSTAAYTYQLNSSRVATELLSAGVQTWNKDWTTYRQYNQAANQYEAEANPTPVWRKHKSYRWANNRLNAQGGTTIADFTAFNWAAGATQAANWQKDVEVTQYDHFSRPLEVQDLNGDFVARKTGHNQTQVIAQAVNARYAELAYSGAEDLTSWGHFGGEVREAGRRTTAPVHTGSYSSRLTPGQSGFTYQAPVGAGLTAGRTYRLSAWVNASDLGSANGRLYASLNGTPLGEARINSATTKKAGSWYLLSLNVTIPAGATGQTLTVGCQHTGNSGPDVYFDDFRFHPLDAPMKSYVYDPQSWQTTYVLDGDNLFTHYEYDAKGNLYRIYKEVLDRPNETSRPERIVKEYSSNYGRSASFTVRASAQGTGQLTSSQPGGGLVNTVEVGDEVRYTATSTDCHSLFNWYEPGAVTVDGTAITSSQTLSDGTEVQLLADGCRLRNVRGAHNVVLQFTSYTFEPAGTQVDVTCEICASTGQNTGYVLYRIADGCGGVVDQEYSRRYSNNECPRNLARDSEAAALPMPEDCVAVRGETVKNPSTKKTRSAKPTKAPRPARRPS